MANRLVALAGADHVELDDGTLGCNRNHARVWQWHAQHPAQWSVTLEDDAVPVDGFREQLAAALATAPAPVVSLYLGTGYIDDCRTGALIRRAGETQACWLVTRGVVHSAVALCVLGDLVGSLAERLYRFTPIDRDISRWARTSGYRVAYTVPSLVEHADVASLVSRHRRARRQAWCVGQRAEWTDHAIAAE